MLVYPYIRSKTIQILENNPDIDNLCVNDLHARSQKLYDYLKNYYYPVYENNKLSGVNICGKFYNKWMPLKEFLNDLIKQEQQTTLTSHI